MHKKLSACCRLPKMRLVFLSSIYLLNKLVVPKEYEVGPTLNYPICRIGRYKRMRLDCVRSQGNMYIFCCSKPSLFVLRNSELCL